MEEFLISGDKPNIDCRMYKRKPTVENVALLARKTRTLPD
jgi:hypothetical protein